MNHAIYTAIDVYLNRQDFQEVEAGSMWKTKPKEKERSGRNRYQQREEPDYEAEMIAMPELPLDVEEDLVSGEEE
jgi:hypothetical protein